jgi:GT2 family glycosyltransferase
VARRLLQSLVFGQEAIFAMTVAAVIPHWNRRALLANLLENLKRQTRPFEEVIVVDNGSTDGSAEMAEQAGARVLRLGSNLGFAAAVNRGIEGVIQGIDDAHADWIAILNNDVILEPEWLETMLKALPPASGQEVAWFGCGKILRADDESIVDATFDEVSRAACAWRCGSGRPDAPVWNQPRTIHMAPMTAALFQTRLFKEAGMLDEAFESYLEDVDFGLRCAYMGRTGAYVPGAVARHVGSATLGAWNKDTVRRIARNQVLLAKKHFRGMAVWRIVAGQLLWGLVACRHGRGISYLRGKLQGFLAKTATAPYGHGWEGRLLEESERRIFDLQRETGFDLYWRAYFWLSRR